MATPISEDPVPTSRKPSDSAFKQQRLPAWQPILTAGTVLPTFFVIGLAFIPIGIGLLVSSQEVQEYPLDYTNCKDKYTGMNCGVNISADNSAGPCTCEEEFDLQKAFKDKIFVYYGLTSYYQNHRRYVKSRDDKQLLGELNKVDKNCEPYRFANETIPIAPCGAVANSMFNDTFKLEQLTDKGWEEITISRNGIIWPSDHKKYKNPPNYEEVFKGMAHPPNWPVSVADLDLKNQSNTGYQNEALIVWMRTAALPTFRKLYGRVTNSPSSSDSSLPAGRYKLTVNYNYPVTVFKGTKRMILSNTSWLGGKNNFLGITYIVVGSICLLLAFVFLIIHNKFGKRRLDLVDLDRNTS